MVEVLREERHQRSPFGQDLNRGAVGEVQSDLAPVPGLPVRVQVQRGCDVSGAASDEVVAVARVRGAGRIDGQMGFIVGEAEIKAAVQGDPQFMERRNQRLFDRRGGLAGDPSDFIATEHRIQTPGRATTDPGGPEFAFPPPLGGNSAQFRAVLRGQGVVMDRPARSREVPGQCVVIDVQPQGRFDCGSGIRIGFRSQLQRRFDAISAPCPSEASLPQTTVGSIPCMPTWMLKPQSTPAMTFSRPTMFA